VRYRIGKRLEFLVGCYQLTVELANFGLALPTVFELNLELACVAKIVLDAALNGDDGRHDHGREHKRQKVREVSRGNVEGVERLHEKIIEHRCGQQNGDHSGPSPRVPGYKTDVEDHEGQLWGSSTSRNWYSWIASAMAVAATTETIANP
jgi:hypothetical protein